MAKKMSTALFRCRKFSSSSSLLTNGFEKPGGLGVIPG
jgi:hypothetical protein